jgi:APA family basic amino acid/polyamine antiporter
LGAGIYVLIGELAGVVGGLSWLAFGAAFVIAITSATSYAELVTRFPGAARSALYAREAFHSPAVTSTVALGVLVSALATSATTARAFAGDYLDAFVELPHRPVAIIVVGVLALIAATGIESSARVNATLTIVEISGLLLVIVVGILAIVDGGDHSGSLTDGSGDVGVADALAAVALAFFAFLGFEDAVHLSEEVDEPQRVFPRVLLSAVIITGVIYVAVALTASLLVDAGTLARSDGPCWRWCRPDPWRSPTRLSP